LCWVLMWVLLLGGVLSRLWEGVWVGSSNSTPQSTSNVHTHSPHPHHTLSTHTPKIKSLCRVVALWVHIHVQESTSSKSTSSTVHVQTRAMSWWCWWVHDVDGSTIYNSQKDGHQPIPPPPPTKGRSRGIEKGSCRVLPCVAVGNLPGWCWVVGWVEWVREIRIKEVFIGWVGWERALPKRTLQR